MATNGKLAIDFVLDRVTKNMARYAPCDGKGLPQDVKEGAKATSIYFSKELFNGSLPKRLRITAQEVM